MRFHRMRFRVIGITILIFGMNHFVRRQMRHAYYIILTITTFIIAFMILVMNQMGLFQLSDIIRFVWAHFARVNLFLGFNFVYGFIVVWMLKHFVMLYSQAIRCIILTVSTFDRVFLVIMIEQMFFQVEYVNLDFYSKL